MRRVIPAALVVGALVAAMIFYLEPDIDLAVAGLFYAGQNRFVGQTPLGSTARGVAYYVPTAILLGCCALFLARRFGWTRRAAPTGRALAVLALSFALGPGVLTNLVLKDHSHRPRPYQTLNFGGDDAFRPFYTFDGACNRNCSFVSGEGSAAFWTLAPALLVPAPFGMAAVAASLAFGAGVGTLRMAFGGHYLSDTIFAALFTWAVIWLLWRAVLGRQRALQPRALSPSLDPATDTGPA